MLERMPEHDPRPKAVDVAQLGCSHARPGRFTLETKDFAVEAAKGVEQSSVASSDVQHRTGRRDAVKTAREATPRQAQDGITESREPAR